MDDAGGGLNIFQFLATAVSHAPAITVAAPVPPCIDAHKNNNNNNNTVIVKKKPRKVDALVTGAYCHRPEENVWECLTCRKQLTTEQGVKTHVYNVHVLPNGSQQQQQQQQQNDDRIPPPVMIQTASGAGDVTPIMCVECGKSFPNEDALFQHNVAKHSGVYTSLKPSWSAHESQGTLDATTALCVERRDETKQQFECDICGWCFDDTAKLASHMEGWTPIAEDKEGFACVHCSSKFASERALHQHENFCAYRTTTNEIITKT